VLVAEWIGNGLQTR